MTVKRTLKFVVYPKQDAMPRIGEHMFASAPIVSFAADGVGVNELDAVTEAIREETGCRPSHYLAGWRTYAELYVVAESVRIDRRERLSLGLGGTLRFDGIEVVCDPTDAQVLIAVPEFRFIPGRELPKGAVWRPSSTQGVE